MMAAVAALWAMPAQAVTMYATLTGTLTQQTTTGDPVSFGVSSQITLHARFDSADVVTWGDTGYQVVGFRKPGDAFDFTLNEYHWGEGDEQNGFFPFYTYDNYPVETRYTSMPALVLKDGKVAGVMGKMVPAGSETPVMRNSSFTAGGSTYCKGGVCNSVFEPLFLSDTFTLEKGNFLYANTYDGPEFNGIWNFSQSSVGVPEPSTWALMILGIGMAGAGLRRRRRAYALA